MNSWKERAMLLGPDQSCFSVKDTKCCPSVPICTEVCWSPCTMFFSSPLCIGRSWSLQPQMSVTMITHTNSNGCKLATELPLTLVYWWGDLTSVLSSGSYLWSQESHPSLLMGWPVRSKCVCWLPEPETCWCWAVSWASIHSALGGTPSGWSWFPRHFPVPGVGLLLGTFGGRASPEHCKHYLMCVNGTPCQMSLLEL